MSSRGDSKQNRSQTKFRQGRIGELGLFANMCCPIRGKQLRTLGNETQRLPFAHAFSFSILQSIKSQHSPAEDTMTNFELQPASNPPVLSLIGNTPLIPLRFNPEGITLYAK